MNRAEMRPKVREQEKCRLPLNFKMQLGQVARIIKILMVAVLKMGNYIG